MKSTNLTFIVIVVLSFCSTGWAETKPSDAVKLRLLCKAIVEKENQVSLDCWIVFYGKSSSLARIPPVGVAYVAEFTESPRLRIDDSGREEMLPREPFYRYQNSISYSSPASLVAIPHSMTDGRFEHANVFETRLHLCDTRIYKGILSRNGVLTVAVDLETLEFPLGHAIPSVEELLSRFTKKSVEIQLDSRELRNLKRQEDKKGEESKDGEAAKRSGKPVLSDTKGKDKGDRSNLPK